MNAFIQFIIEYFRGITREAKTREMFIVKGDLRTSTVKERWAAYIRGVDLVLREFIKRLEEWNVFMGVGFTAGHWEITPSVIQYDRLAYDFDSEEDPAGAANTALAFAKAVEKEFGAVGIVFVTGFKGAHVVIPLARPVGWEAYKGLWKNLLQLTDRKFVDANMLQWNRVDRVPLTWNIKGDKARFCRIIYPREFTWEDFNWGELKPLDPSDFKTVTILTPQVVKPKPLASGKPEKSWIWKIVETGLPDGRKRFILSVLVPHLVSLGKDENDILVVCREFLDNSCRNFSKCDKIYDSWIKSVIRSAKARGFKGYGLSIIQQKDPDLYGKITETIKR
ncbi:MAG: DNA primase noncatalytic subunit PriX [Nanopusillaceae archaeon]